MKGLSKGVIGLDLLCGGWVGGGGYGDWEVSEEVIVIVSGEEKCWGVTLGNKDYFGGRES